MSTSMNTQPNFVEIYSEVMLPKEYEYLGYVMSYWVESSDCGKHYVGKCEELNYTFSNFIQVGLIADFQIAVDLYESDRKDSEHIMLECESDYCTGMTLAEYEAAYAEFHEKDFEDDEWLGIEGSDFDI